MTCRTSGVVVCVAGCSDAKAAVAAGFAAGAASVAATVSGAFTGAALDAASWVVAEFEVVLVLSTCDVGSLVLWAAAGAEFSTVSEPDVDSDSVEGGAGGRRCREIDHYGIQIQGGRDLRVGRINETPECPGHRGLGFRVTRVVGRTRRGL